MVRDHSEILQPFRKSRENLLPNDDEDQKGSDIYNPADADGEQTMPNDRILFNSNSAGDGIILKDHVGSTGKLQQPFLNNLSQ